MILLSFIKTSDPETSPSQVLLKTNLKGKRLETPKKMITKLCSEIVINLQSSRKLLGKNNKRDMLKDSKIFKNPVKKSKKELKKDFKMKEMLAMNF